MDNQFIRPQKETTKNPLDESPKLFDSALTEFAAKPYDNASLNDIIKSSGISKGSFYHKFKDKMDLYLCVMDVISRQKAAFSKETTMPDDFFAQLRLMFRRGLEFAQEEPRYYTFWRLHLAEGNEVKSAVQRAFPNRRNSSLDTLVEGAIKSGQLDFPLPFVSGIINLLVSHIDTLILPDMSHDDILALTDNLVDMLQNGMSHPKEANRLAQAFLID